ncbi:hypothetical protein LINPERHAP1_LOCUS12750 [Linum perenne]
MMTTQDFVRSVEDGIKLSKRIYLGKDRAVAPPKIPVTMDKSDIDAFLPTSPMVYAVITNPGIVDNPDIPSYQPHVHGRCDPPALIPLQMNRIDLQVDCFFDRIFVQITGSWRVHCVMGSKNCDCRIVIPMGEQGSILGLEVEVHMKSYATEVIAVHDKDGEDKQPRPENGGYLKHNIFTVTVPKVDGGTILSIKASWMQKSQFKNGEFSVDIPFSFPEYVTPFAKKLPKKEKIQLNVNSGSATEIICRNTSHPLKVRREAGKLCFAYETEVLNWTHNDFTFAYTIPSNDVFGGVLLQSPSVHDTDQREMFSVYLYPGDQQSKKAMEMVSKKSGIIPLIFLVTDGTVEDERHICEAMKNECIVGEEISPRIHTFGIGFYCNHHFLRMLALLGRGANDAAYEVDFIETRLQSFFSRALSPILANITLSALDNAHELEVFHSLQQTFPSRLPDLSSEGLWIISGRYVGDVPDFLRVEGVMGDLSRFIVDLKTRNAKDIPLDKIFAKQRIDILTSHAWFSISKELEEEVSKMSVQTGVVSEYTHMSVMETERVYQGKEHPGGRKTKKGSNSEKGESARQRRTVLGGMGIGFGDMGATIDNTRPGVEEQKLSEAAEKIIKAASNCCGKLYGDCC